MKGCPAFPKVPASECLVSYPGHSFEVGFTSPQRCSLEYSTAPADWATFLKSFFARDYGISIFLSMMDNFKKVNLILFKESISI